MHYWWAPRGTSRERVDALVTALRKVGETEFVKAKMDELCCNPIFVTDDALQSRLAALDSRLSGLAPSRPPELPDYPTIALVVTLALLALILAGPRLRGRRDRPVESTIEPDPSATREVPDRVGRARVALCAVLTIAYTGVLASEVAPFHLATTVFVFATGATLADRRRALPVLAVVALATGFGLDWALSNFFTVQMP